MLKVGRRVAVNCCVPRLRLVGCVALLVTARSAVGNGGGGGAGGGGGGGMSGCEKHIAIQCSLLLYSVQVVRRKSVVNN